MAHLVKSIGNFRLKLIGHCGVPSSLLRALKLHKVDAIIFICDVFARCGEVCIRARDYVVKGVSAAHLLVYNYFN